MSKPIKGDERHPCQHGCCPVVFPSTTLPVPPTASSHWITSRLVASAYPGKKSDPVGHRSTIQAFVDAGITHWISLQTEDEAAGFTPYDDMADQLWADRQGHGQGNGSNTSSSSSLLSSSSSSSLSSTTAAPASSKEELGHRTTRPIFLRFPIPDRGVASDAITTKIVYAITEILTHSQDTKILIHCHGGHHRTGVIVALWLASHFRGLSAKAALDLNHKAKITQRTDLGKTTHKTLYGIQKKQVERLAPILTATASDRFHTRKPTSVRLPSTSMSRDILWVGKRRLEVLSSSSSPSTSPTRSTNIAVVAPSCSSSSPGGVRVPDSSHREDKDRVEDKKDENSDTTTLSPPRAKRMRVSSGSSESMYLPVRPSSPATVVSDVASSVSSSSSSAASTSTVSRPLPDIVFFWSGKKRSEKKMTRKQKRHHDKKDDEYENDASELDKEKLGPYCLSQWYRCEFRDPTTKQVYTSAEQYMMVRKAETFGDDTARAAILKTKVPKKQKELGRSVKGFHQGKWNMVRFEIVVQGNMWKFSQHAGLRNYLLSTGQSLLAEASPSDPVWGIGLTAASASKQKPEDWPGINLLGKALMCVRSNLASSSP